MTNFCESCCSAPDICDCAKPRPITVSYLGASQEAPECVVVNGVWYDRRDTVESLSSLLQRARQERDEAMRQRETAIKAFVDSYRDFKTKINLPLPECA